MKRMALEQRGRPPKGEKRETLVLVNFRADKRTLDAIARLEEAAGPGLVQGRSTVIRRAIIEAAEQLKKEHRR
jgi:hypothetical protein